MKRTGPINYTWLAHELTRAIRAQRVLLWDPNTQTHLTLAASEPVTANGRLLTLTLASAPVATPTPEREVAAV